MRSKFIFTTGSEALLASSASRGTKTKDMSPPKETLRKGGQRRVQGRPSEGRRNRETIYQK